MRREASTAAVVAQWCAEHNLMGDLYPSSAHSGSASRGPTCTAEVSETVARLAPPRTKSKGLRRDKVCKTRAQVLCCRRPGCSSDSMFTPECCRRVARDDFMKVTPAEPCESRSCSTVLRVLPISAHLWPTSTLFDPSLPMLVNLCPVSVDLGQDWHLSGHIWPRNSPTRNVE